MKEQFITQYVASWLAARTVKEYDNACFTGKHERLHTPPVEDAVFLANKAWDHLIKTEGENWNQ